MSSRDNDQHRRPLGSPSRRRSTHNCTSSIISIFPELSTRCKNRFVIAILLVLAVQLYLGRSIAKKYFINLPTNNYEDNSKKPSRIRNYSQKPRVVAIVDNDGHQVFLPLELTNATRPYNLIKNSNYSIPDDPPIIINSTWYELNAAQYLEKIYDLNACQPMHEWQHQSYPNCNSFHEIDFTKMLYITSGTRRSAFELREAVNGREDQFVYKTIMYNYGEFKEKRVEMQRVDALVLEKTHSSKFTPAIHGYCSIGVLMDFTPEGSLFDYVKGARLAGGSTLPPVERLRIAIHIAAGVADLHSIDESPVPSFYHDDLDWHQYLYVDGIFMLNDFNYAKPIYVQKNDTSEVCRLTKGHLGIWKNRALEEFQAIANYSGFTPFRPDTIDVWMMGNQIYTIMTDLWPYEKPVNLNRMQTLYKVISGERTEIPEHISNSDDPSYKAMMEALDMCWTYRWDKRPSARVISDYLIGKLREITGDENPDLRVVLPERDPDQRNTESDYLLYNDGAND